jgi:hypothetical protein
MHMHDWRGTASNRLRGCVRTSCVRGFVKMFVVHETASGGLRLEQTFGLKLYRLGVPSGIRWLQVDGGVSGVGKGCIHDYKKRAQKIKLKDGNLMHPVQLRLYRDPP